ncbi:MAG: GPP34 family phosphoprotein [Chloroflexi bacterium]|nr:GPP34 family phosphoprotein [Chloroflexota bacterium]
MLNLAEELFLVALDEDEGWIAAPALNTLRYGLAAAFLADLALQGKIVVEDQRVSVLDPAPVGDDLLDETLQRLVKAGRPRKVKYWLNALGFRKLPKQVAEYLEGRGVLRADEKRYLWVLPYAIYPQQDASAKYWIKQNLRAAALTNTRPDRRGVELLSLLKGCRLLNLVFTKDERKAAGKRIDELVKGEDFGDAVAQTLADIEAATTAAAATVG